MPMTLGWKTLSRNGDVRGNSDDVSVWVLEKQTDPIHTESEHSGWSQRRRFLRRALQENNIVVPTVNTTTAYNSLRVAPQSN